MKSEAIADQPQAEYRNAGALNSTAIKTVLRSPLHYRHEYLDGNKREATPAMHLGTLVHQLVLEPEKDLDGFRVVNATTRSTKAYKDAVASCPADIVLLAAEHDTARAIADAVLNHPRAKALLVGAERETSIYWHEGDRLCQCRPDIRRPDLSVMADLKTAADASPDGFRRAIANYGYHISAAWYLRGEAAHYGEASRSWVFVVVESSPPHAVQLYFADDYMIEKGHALCNEALRRLDEAEESEHWSSYSDSILPIELPPWAR